MNTDGRIRSNVVKGAEVLIVQKRHQRTGKLTRGIVRDILTRSQSHPRGIKVRLEDGRIGRVQEIVARKTV
ncbi:MAG: YwbE family protein [Candidatus Bathyarchaeota archaeon]|nr:MAG: YwbE family protein [Candidatus Bathyarchaeota archaeon]